MARDEHGFDPDETTYDADNPFWDGTDFAHPAYHRGVDRGIEAVLEVMVKALEGKDDGRGVMHHPDLEAMRRLMMKIEQGLKRP
jgi:hypothetical protein